MQPIYKAYLKSGGSEIEPLYKFIIWGQSKASEFRKEFKLCPIVNHEKYLKFLEITR